jgi:hypothetical protein
MIGADGRLSFGALKIYPIWQSAEDEPNVFAGHHVA